jgi:hypothetical protein
MGKQEVGIRNYLYRLAPDFSIIDKAEKDYWTKNSGYVIEDNIWYNIYELSTEKGSEVATDAYRGMFCSDKTLDFEIDSDIGRTSYGITKIDNLYGGRHVYIVCVDDSDKFHMPIIVKASDLKVGEICYVTGVFF